MPIQITEENLEKIKVNLEIFASSIISNNPDVKTNAMTFTRSLINRPPYKELDNYQVYEKTLYKETHAVLQIIKKEKRECPEHILKEANRLRGDIEKSWNVEEWSFNADIGSYEDRLEVYDRAVYRAWGRAIDQIENVLRFAREK